jgi:hypothetical protein
MSANRTPEPTPSHGQPAVRVTQEAAPVADSGPGRVGPATLIVLGLLGVCLSCSIIALAGLAGYNDGLHQVEQAERVTREADINRQYDLALTDVADGNRDLAGLRLEHIVVTLGADHPEAQALLTEVRAVSPTPTASPTFTPSPTLADTVTPTLTPTAGLPPLDPAALFEEAQSASVGRDFERTIQVLNVLISLDPDYRKSEVESMLHDALSSLALTYLREPSGDHLAEGILLAQQAQAIAPIGDLAYEAYIAGRYLDGMASNGLECLLSVREWESVYNEASQYRDVPARLASAYARCGDAYTYQTEFCPAEQYYRWSLQIANNTDVLAKLRDAADMCAQATPTPTPTVEGVPPEGTPPEGEQPPPA